MDVLTFIAALAQHISWPAALVAVAFGFRHEFRHLANRLTRGKYKDVEVTFESLFSLDVESQKEKIAAAVGSPLASRPHTDAEDGNDSPISTRSTGPQNSVRLQMKDLALRMFQLQCGRPIMRDVKGHAAGGYDGVFVELRSVNVVEVVFMDTPGIIDLLKVRLRELAESNLLNGWTRSQISLLLTFEADVSHSLLTSVDRMRASFYNDHGVAVSVAVYSLKNLRQHFGIDDKK